MNQDSLAEYYLFINEQIILQEKLLEYHLKAESLLTVLLETNLNRYSYLILHHYLWNVDDNVGRAKTLNKFLLNTLHKISALMEPPRNPPKDMH
jgi:hypothetical protein